MLGLSSSYSVRGVSDAARRISHATRTVPSIRAGPWDKEPTLAAGKGCGGQSSGEKAQ